MKTITQEIIVAVMSIPRARNQLVLKYLLKTHTHARNARNEAITVAYGRKNRNRLATAKTIAYTIGPIRVASIARPSVALLPTITLAAKYVGIAITIQVIISPANHNRKPANFQTPISITP